MSRIFEALQKANLEGMNGQGALGEVVINPIASLGLTSPFLPKEGIQAETFTPRSWSPQVAALPALEERGAPVEQFRRLRSHLYQLRDDGAIKTILISSGMPEEGKSFVAANLAVSMAQKGGSQILLVDGDLRRPTLHTLLGAPNGPGLAEYLSGSTNLNDIIQRSRSENGAAGSRKPGLSNLSFVAAGRCGDNSSELVAHPRFEEMMRALADRFDWILVDSPPALVVTDAIDLARTADAVLLVARGARTPFDVAQRAQRAFSNYRVLGFVLNDVTNAPTSGYGYYSGQRIA